MIDFKKILVPVDFSEHSLFAAQKAISLAQVCKATVYVLHVGDDAKQSAKAVCRFLDGIHAANQVTLKKLVAQGTPATIILATAKKLGVDYIIMGHRGLSGLKYLVYGSVAEQVLRQSPCPVLIIKKPKSAEMDNYMLPQLRNLEETFLVDKILVPLDFSEPSKEAFRHAMYLASFYNSTIYTLTVFDKKYKEVGDDRKKHTAVVVYGKKIHLWREFPELLATTPYNDSGRRVKRVLLEGDPAAQIESLAQEKEIDLVVMGTNGRTGLQHLFIGSVAEKVLRSVKCPVMTIRTKRPALYVR